MNAVWARRPPPSARRGAAIRCWTRAGWEARAAEWATRWPGQGPLGPWRAYTSDDPYLAVDLSPNICAELRALVERKGRVRSDPAPDALAWAVAAVAHESVHVSGIAEGRYLATLYWKHWYPWNRPPYRSRECRNRRALDLRPATASWP
jgi:hypothetical protein